jgi:hypothetical protein
VTWRRRGRTSPKPSTPAELFAGALEDYIKESEALAREEARIREEHKRETKRIREEAGRRYAAMLGLDAETCWEPASVMILSPSVEWRLKACRTLLTEIQKQASAPEKARVA